MKIYTKLSLYLLLLISTLAISLIFINYHSLIRLYDRVEQELNWNYASSIKEELQPIIEESFSSDMVKSQIHYMMVLNPMVEIYLIDSTGKILSFFTQPGDILALNSIDITPIEQFIYHGSMLPILGDDPKDKQNKKPFSAAPINFGGEMGYIYVILRGQSFDRNLAMSSGYYIRESGIYVFFFILLIVLILGFILFFQLTKPIRSLNEQVELLKQGRYINKTPISVKDELGILTNTFYDMANRQSKTISNLRNLSHDLRSPLTAVQGALETLESKNGKNSYTTIGLKSTNSITKLIDLVFDLIKLENREILPQYEMFSMVELIYDITSSYSTSITITPPEKDIFIYADISLIERAVRNILDNSVKYNDNSVEITINFSTNKTFVELHIRDNGVGIDREDLDYVFQRFYRGKSDTEGSGLGLSIVKEIITLHTGYISIENSNGVLAKIGLPKKVKNI